MTRPGGIFKRPPMWLPSEVHERMSKSDLADVAYDLALRLTGNENADDALALIQKTHDDLLVYRQQQAEERRQS